MKVPASALIFKDIRIRGFWMSAWNKTHRKPSSSSISSSSADPSQEMIDFLCSMIREGELSTPKLRQVPFDDFQDALKMSITPMITEKQVLIFWAGDMKGAAWTNVKMDAGFNNRSSVMMKWPWSSFHSGLTVSWRLTMKFYTLFVFGI